MIREARAMARLVHPNIVTIFDAGEVDSTAYIAMELVIGTTLAEWLAAQPRSVDEVVTAFVAAGRGLIAAHEAGIVHRDVKPANILIDRRGRVAVTDFGIARIEGSARPLPAGTPAEDRGATQTCGVMGTPAYMSPEQYLSANVDARSDQFSFAVALYEALFRTTPFPGRTADERRTALLTGTLAPLDPRAKARVPPRLCLAIERALSRDPAARFPRMNELVAELVLLQAQPERRPTGRAPLVSGLGALAVSLVLVVTALVVRQGDHTAGTLPSSAAVSPSAPTQPPPAPQTPARLAVLNESVLTNRLHRGGWNLVSADVRPSIGVTSFAAQSSKTKQWASVALYDAASAAAVSAIVAGCQVSHLECDSGGTRVLSVRVQGDPETARSLLKLIERP
jgi:serine/threonine protein kinase